MFHIEFDNWMSSPLYLQIHIINLSLPSNHNQPSLIIKEKCKYRLHYPHLGHVVIPFHWLLDPRSDLGTLDIRWEFTSTYQITWLRNRYCGLKIYSTPLEFVQFVFSLQVPRDPDERYVTDLHRWNIKTANIFWRKAPQLNCHWKHLVWRKGVKLKLRKHSNEVKD